MSYLLADSIDTTTRYCTWRNPHVGHCILSAAHVAVRIHWSATAVADLRKVFQHTLFNRNRSNNWLLLSRVVTPVPAELVTFQSIYVQLYLGSSFTYSQRTTSNVLLESLTLNITFFCMLTLDILVHMNIIRLKCNFFYFGKCNEVFKHLSHRFLLFDLCWEEILHFLSWRHNRKWEKKLSKERGILFFDSVHQLPLLYGFPLPLALMTILKFTFSLPICYTDSGSLDK